MANLLSSAAPHIHSKNDTGRIMLDVILALVPATIAAIVLFGTKAALLVLVCVATAIVCELVFSLATKRGLTIKDGSSFVTGLLLALNLSTNVELWQAAVGTAFAIVIVKCLFGGLGKNIVNPAIGGRVFMILVFASVAGGAAPTFGGVDALTSATPLDMIKSGAQLPTMGQMLLGLHGGAIGETCIVALVLGGIYLVVRDVIKWYVPCTFIGTVFILTLVFSGSFTTAVYAILSGGLFLGAIFMATDYVTTPITNKGKVVFALGCGIITFIIRQWLNYPEGVSFSIIVMNLLVPFIEKVTKNPVLGGGKK